MDRAELERLDREGLVQRAQVAGIKRARLLTRPELIDELLRLHPVDHAHLKRSRGFFGIARDLLSRVVERGLHLPDAAERLRAALGSPLPQVPRPEPQAVPTATLAEIYAAQGHRARAIETLHRVLEAEPEHAAARTLLEKLEAAGYVSPEPLLPPEISEVSDEIGTHPLGSPAVEAPEAATSAPEDRAVAVVGSPSSTVETRSRQAFSSSVCVAIPLGDESASENAFPSALRQRIYVWWALSPDDRARASQDGFVVRAVVIVPSWDGPLRQTHDLACDPAAGELVLRDLPAGAVVRVAAGVMVEGELVPLAHSPAVERTNGQLALWTLEGIIPIEGRGESSRAIALAIEGAARSAG